MSATEIKKGGSPGTAMTPKQCNDAGLALVFILLLVALLGKQGWALPAAVACTLLVMTFPAAFRPFAVLWFGLSHAMGTVVSKLLLSLMFYGIVTPVGLLRRALGKDPMRLSQWKAGEGSVFRVRGETVRAEDLERPF